MLVSDNRGETYRDGFVHFVAVEFFRSLHEGKDNVLKIPAELGFQLFDEILVVESSKTWLYYGYKCGLMW